MTSQAKTQTKPGNNGKAKKLHMPKWNYLRLIIKFREPGVAGNQPAEGQLERYTKLLAVGASNEIKMQIQEEGEGSVTPETIKAYINSCTAFLPVDEEGFYIRENQVIGMLCMAGARTKWTTERKGMKSTLIQGTTRIEPSRLYLRNGELNVPARGMNTPNSGGVIKSAQVISGMDPIEFIIKWLDNRDITVSDMKGLLSLGQEIGLGGDRRFGYGRFDILEMQKVKNGGCS